MRTLIALMAYLLLSFSYALAQDQFLGKSLAEVKAILQKNRIAYQEQLSPMGDQTTLSYSASETHPQRIDLFFTHSLSFQMGPKSICTQLISIPMLQKAWTADTIKNRLLASGFKKKDDSQFVHEPANRIATLEFMSDTQQPNVKMLRVVFKTISKPTE